MTHVQGNSTAHNGWCVVCSISIDRCSAIRLKSRLVKRMDAFAQLHPRHGNRMMWGTLRLEWWRIYVKRVHRLCQRKGFCVPQKHFKGRRFETNANGIDRAAASHRNDV